MPPLSKSRAQHVCDISTHRHIDLDKLQMCTACKHHSAVKLWKCTCGKPWHLCPKHKNAPVPQLTHATMLPSNGQPSVTTRAAKRKRKQPPSYRLTYHEILAVDLRNIQEKEEREAHDFENRFILFGNTAHHSINSNSLSPNLKRRFMGELGSSTSA